MNDSKQTMPEINVTKSLSAVLIVYIVLIVSFYLLAGEQLLFRDSRGNLKMPPAEASAAELYAGIVVEQRFYAPIQRLEGVSVQWGTHYRANDGTVTLALLREDTGEQLFSGSFDAALVGEGQVLSITSEEPIETVHNCPLVLRLTADCKPGSALSPMIHTGNGQAGFSLSVNGEQIPGILCFSAYGTDYIWTGIHYWEFSVGLGVALVLLCLVVWLRWKRGKHSYIINALIAVHKYRFLIRQLVGRDFKTKYRRSVIGVFWSFLNPLLMMLVQYYVFSTLFRNDIPGFAAYLIVGTVTFNFFSESCGLTLGSILGNAGLIAKVYMPKYIFPLTRTMSSVVNLTISLIPMTIVCLITGVHLKKAALLSLFFFACLIVFCLGLGMLLATSMVFFRDTQFLWGVLSIMWMYVTPIFYPETILPANNQIILRLNPLYHYLKAIRMCIISGLSPEPIVYFRCMAISLAALLIGAFVFYKNQDKFDLYL